MKRYLRYTRALHYGASNAPASSASVPTDDTAHIVKLKTRHSVELFTVDNIEQEFTMKGEPDDPVLHPARDPAFRRLVLSSYGSTCAVCGARLMTASGISIIDHEELYETPGNLEGRRIHRATGVV